MTMPTKAPAPDKPGSLGLRLDHRTQGGPTVQTNKTAQLKRHTQSHTGQCQMKPESTAHHLSRCDRALG